MPDPDSTDLVRYDLTGGRVTLTLDSPANRNALSARLVGQLHEGLSAALDSPAVRVVVLTGAGPVFCSGADLTERRTAPEAAAGAFSDVLLLILQAGKPVLCRLNGLARAGGIGLFAACDIVIAPRSATFAFTEVRLGLVPAVISVPVLRRLTVTAATELFMTGEVFDATRAERVGLVDRAVADEALDAEVDRYVDMLARGGPEAMGLVKQMVATVTGRPPAEALPEMDALSRQRFASAEAREGFTARAEKRDPDWYVAPPG
ncbi:MAG: enoyl-CoA hydratase-related protein [Actinomycetota bacterium]|nr:enoyl-CoA hydratase-related protein [Actinomycetota bacterium]